MTTFHDIAPLLEGQAIEVPPGRKATPASGSRSSAPRAHPRSVEEKSPTQRRCTGSPAWHRRSRCTLPWGLADFAKLRAYAEDLGVAVGTINSNTFQDDGY